VPRLWRKKWLLHATLCHRAKQAAEAKRQYDYTATKAAAKAAKLFGVASCGVQPNTSILRQVVKVTTPE
jgi:hypothetical protein